MGKREHAQPLQLSTSYISKFWAKLGDRSAGVDNQRQAVQLARERAELVLQLGHIDSISSCVQPLSSRFST
jgi:hypothetical protein